MTPQGGLHAACWIFISRAVNRVFLAFLAAAAAGLLSSCDQMTALLKPSAESGAQGQILFLDDFSSTNNGWDTWTDPDGSFIAIQNDGLRILVNRTQYDFWTTFGRSFSDSIIDVDAVKLSGPDDNDFGVICRYQNRDNYYVFLTSSDGYSGIVKLKNGNYTILTGGEFTASSIIHTGQAVNHLRADCTGQTLALRINGQMVLETKDSDFQTGEVGLFAGTFSSSGTDIFFDNFVVIQP